MRLDHIDEGNNFDFGKTSKDYAKYRDIYPDEFYRRVVDLGLCVKGQSALDLGTGSGVLPRNMYRYGASWTGTDISEEQIREAKRMALELGMDIPFFAATAEKTGLPDSSFDVVTACMCFFYFDKSKVVPEIVRMLKPGGHFLTLFMAWLPKESEIAAESEKIVLKYNPSWTGKSFVRFEHSVPEWSEDYFDCEDIIDFDLDVSFTRDSWHGRIKSCRGVGASLSAEAMAEFEREHLAMLEQLAPDRFDMPHYASILNFRKR